MVGTYDLRQNLSVPPVACNWDHALAYGDRAFLSTGDSILVLCDACFGLLKYRIHNSLFFNADRFVDLNVSA